VNNKMTNVLLQMSVTLTRKQDRSLSENMKVLSLPKYLGQQYQNLL